MKARFVLPLLVLLVFIPSVSPAQTVYTQTAPANCQIDDYVCNGIPLGYEMAYSVSDPQMLSVGDPFTLVLAGTPYFGKITKVTLPPPVLVYGNEGDFSFTWQAGSVTGTVSGYIFVNTCHRRGCIYATIETSTVTLN